MHLSLYRLLTEQTPFAANNKKYVSIWNLCRRPNSYIASNIFATISGYWLGPSTFHATHTSSIFLPGIPKSFRPAPVVVVDDEVYERVSIVAVVAVIIISFFKQQQKLLFKQNKNCF